MSSTIGLERTGAVASTPTLIRRLHQVEDGVINVVLAIMAILPVIEIVLRKILGQGLPGSMAIVQHMTLWAGFLGALLCSRENKHLSLATSEVLPAGTPRAIAKLFTHSVAAAVTALLAYASFQMVVADSQNTQPAFWNVPGWWIELVMPAALALMACRFVWRASAGPVGKVFAVVAIALAFALGGFEIDSEGVRWLGVVLLLGALLAGAPIFVAMSGLAMLLFFTEGTPIAAVPAETLRLVISPTLPAIPLLTVAGCVLGQGGAAKRLVRASRALIGWAPGGVAVVVCLVCAVFTTFTGGSGVTILALGGLVLPILLQEKYPEGFSLGLVTASGSLGLLFPPSLPVILYSIVAQIPDLNALFVAGLIPGTLMIALVCVYGVIVGIRSGTHRTPFDSKEAVSALWEAKWELGLPIVIGVVVLSGWATIVEAVAVACLYAVLIEVVVFKDIPIRDLPKAVSQGATLVGSVLIVLGVALGLTSYFVDAGIPELVTDWVRRHVDTQFGFLLVLNLLLLVLGSVFEIYSAIVILAPLVAPLGVHYGLDPIHLAIVFLANLELGFLFPPVGLNLFLSSSRFQKPLPQLYKHALPFLCIMAIALLLITYIPAMTTGVLELFGMQPAPTLQ